MTRTLIPTLLCLALLPLSVRAAQSITTPSNGITHTVYWSASDNSFYHISAKGASQDTHLVKRYGYNYLGVDSTGLSVGTAAGFDTAYNSFGYGFAQHTEIRNDTVFQWDTLGGYATTVVLVDTFVQVRLGRYLNPAGLQYAPDYANKSPLRSTRTSDYLIVNGVRVKIRGFRTDYFFNDTTTAWIVEKNCPTGTGLSVNATYRSIPSIKRVTADPEAGKYAFKADPGRPNKLYLFYISDSGRVMGLTSSDFGLMWEEMVQAQRNSICTDTSDHSRNAIAAAFAGDSIVLTWSGATLPRRAALHVPADPDTVVMFVRPDGNAARDQNYRNNPAITVFSPDSAFNSIDRAINQIIMLENNVTWAQAASAPSDTNMGYRRATATRAYRIKLFPGNYNPYWHDGSLVTGHGDTLNKVFFPDWERSLTIESYYDNPDSMAAVISWGSGYSAPFLIAPNVKRVNGPNRRFTYFKNPGHITFNRLRFTCNKYFKTLAEYPVTASVIHALNDLETFSNLKMTNNLFYSMDSMPTFTAGARFLHHVMSGSASGASESYLDNIYFANNLFHRLTMMTSDLVNNSSNDYSGGFIFLNNSFYKWRRTSYGFWWSNVVSVGKTIWWNNLSDSAYTAFSYGNPKSVMFSSSDSAGTFRYLNNTFPWLDTSACNLHGPLLHKIPPSSPPASGADVMLAPYLHPTDFYNIPRTEADDYAGACLPAVVNPLRLRLDTLRVGPNLVIKVNIDSAARLDASIDTILVFRDTLGYITDPRTHVDARFSRSLLPASYNSVDVLQPRFWFSVIVGDKRPNGSVNWSSIDSVNRAFIQIPDPFPPQHCFTIDTAGPAVRVGADTIRFRMRSPVAVNPALSREKDLAKIWVYLGPASDSAAFINNYKDTSRYLRSHPYIAFIDGGSRDTFYNDTSLTDTFGGLSPNTRYLAVAVTRDSSGNFCPPETVITYMRSFRTQMAPNNALRVSAQTISQSLADRLIVTVSGFTGLSAFPPIDSAKIKLFIRYAGYVTDPYTPLKTDNNLIARDQYLTLTAAKFSGGVWRDTVTLLQKDTLVYFSVTVPSLAGYSSRIDSINCFSIRTLRLPDSTAPAVSGIRLQTFQPTAPLNNGLYLGFHLSNLNSLSGRDRDSLYLKIMWSGAFDSITDPKADRRPQEMILTPESLQTGLGTPNDTSRDYIVSAGIYPNRLYYFTAAGRDTAFNWSVISRSSGLTDSLQTVVNTARPANMDWPGVSVSGFTSLRVVTPAFSKAGATANTIRKVGIWVLDTLIFGAKALATDSVRLDSLIRQGGRLPDPRHRFLEIDTAGMSLVKLFDTLAHNRGYYVACSPQNVFGNWGTVDSGRSLFLLGTPLDSTKLLQPPNLIKPFKVERMRDPDSVRITWGLPFRQYMDAATRAVLNFDSVLIYYKTDGTYPNVSSGLVSGTFLTGFKIIPNATRDTNQVIAVAGVSPGRTYTFGAVVTNTLPVNLAKYPQRVSRDTVTVQSGPVTPPYAPANNLQVTLRVVAPTQLGVTCTWIDSTSLPAHVKLLYNVVRDSVVPPVSYGDGAFQAAYGYNVHWNPQPDRSRTWDTILGVDSRWLYLVAAYNAAADTVFSKSPMAASPGEQWDTIRMPPPNDIVGPPNKLKLEAAAVNSRTLELTWSDPTGTLPSLLTNEKKLTLWYLYKTDPSPAVPYARVRALDTAAMRVVTGSGDPALRKIRMVGDSDLVNGVRVESNKTYYLVVAVGDSEGNFNDTSALARDTVPLSVPLPSASDLSLSILSDTAFTFNYPALLTNPLSPLQTDPFVKAGRGLLIITDTNRVDSNLFGGPVQTVNEILNGEHNKTHHDAGTGVTFLVRDVSFVGNTGIRTIGSFSAEEHDTINLTRNHYVSFAFITDNNEPGKPIFVNPPLRYVLNAPVLQILNLAQEDSFVKVQFRAADASDSTLGLKVVYALDNPALQDTQALDPSNLRSGYFPFTSTIVRDSQYTAYIQLKSSLISGGISWSDYFAGRDTSTLTLRFALTDFRGPQGPGPDTVAASTLRIDRKAPPRDAGGIPLVRFGFNAPSLLCTVSVHCTAGELSRILYSTQDSVNLTNTVAYHQDTTLVISTPGSVIYMSFMDGFSNRVDTSYTYGNVTGLKIPVLSSTNPYFYDNHNLRLIITNYTTADTANARRANQLDTLSFFWRKYLTQNPATGFAYSSSEMYAFLFTHPTLDSAQVWSQGIQIGLPADSTLAATWGSNLHIYRYDRSTQTVTYVGGEYSGDGFITASGVKCPVVSNPASAVTADTAFFFVGVDTLKPSFYSIDLSQGTAAGQIRLQIRAQDNTRSLIARIKVFGYDSLNTPVPLYTSIRSADTLNLDTILAVSATEEMLRKGLFAAAWVTDQSALDRYRSRRTYRYTRCGLTLDSVTVTLRDLNQYQLVSLPYTLADPLDQDALYVLSGLSQGKYDKDRLRLYRVTDPGDGVAEFTSSGTPGKDGVETDPAFRFESGKAFFLITHYAEDKEVKVTLRNASLPPVSDPVRGYLLKTADAARDGWYMLSAPFAGPINILTMEEVSTLKPATGAYKALSNRIRINPNSWDFVPSSNVLSAADIAQGFAVYLYAGEELVAPVTADYDVLPRAAGRVGRNASLSPWLARITVSDEIGAVLDGSTEFGLSSEAPSSITDFPPLNLRGINLGIRQGNGLLMCDVKKTDGAGKTWTLELANRGRAGDLKLTFEGLSKELPQGWQVWCEDKSRNCAADLLENNGRLPVFAQANSTLKLTVVAGDALFVERNISRKAPAAFELAQNAPNPFNPATCIRFALPDYAGGNAIAGSRMVLDLFDARGRFVKRLLDRTAVPGYHSAVWDAKDRQGRGVASGLYFYRLAVSDASGRTLFIKNRKMLLAR